LTVVEHDAKRLGQLQRGFEEARERIWLDRIGAGLAYRRALREIEDKVAKARRARDEAVLDAVAAGGSYREVAKALGLSHSRIQQIVGAAREAAASPPELL
jgi:DNA-directed RNA polymerase specialized sigma24 family protein